MLWLAQGHVTNSSVSQVIIGTKFSQNRKYFQFGRGISPTSSKDNERNSDWSLASPVCQYFSAIPNKLAGPTNRVLMPHFIFNQKQTLPMRTRQGNFCSLYGLYPATNVQWNKMVLPTSTMI